MKKKLEEWSESTDPHLSSWSAFFIYVLFEKEMKFKDNKIKEKTLVADVFTNHTKNTKELDLFSVFFTQKPQKTINRAKIFYSLINEDKAFKGIKDTNVYCQFISGFLNISQGIQGKKEDKLKKGKILLIASAYGFCNISLEVLKKMMINNVVNNIENYIIELKRKSLKKIIENNFLFDYEQTLFFTTLTDAKKTHMLFLMNNCFESVVEHMYSELTQQKQELYKSLSDSLRSKLVEKRDTAYGFSTIASKLNLILPFITGVLGGITTLYSADNSVLRISGTFSLLVPVCSLLYGFYQWYHAIHTPTYAEKQVKLIGLYYAQESRSSMNTGGSIAQSIVDYFDEHYNHEKTLSQNALAIKNGEI